MISSLATVACFSGSVGYGLRYGFYKQVAQSNNTNITSSLFNDSLKLEQGSEETRPVDTVIVTMSQDTGRDQENYTQVSELTESVPMSQIIYSRHYVPLTNQIFRDINLSYSELEVNQVQS